MLTFALLLATTPVTPTTVVDGEAHRLALIAAFTAQRDAHSVACNAAKQALTTSPTSTVDSCGAVLAADHSLRALKRAGLTRAPKTRLVRCKLPQGLTPVDDERQALDRCLTSTYGRGALAPAVDGDFTFINVARAITGTGVVLTDDEISFTQLADDNDGVHLDVAAAAWTLTGVPPSRALPITSRPPLGSDRVVTDVSDRLEIDTPVVGGVVVCSDRPKTMPLGAFVDVVLQAPGYHPEYDPKRAVYRYAVPCPGAFVGAGVGVKVGRFRQPAASKIEDAGRRIECTDRSITVVVPGRRPLDVVFRCGSEGGSAAIRTIGDINGDGVDDHVVDFADAGGGTSRLYMSKGSSHVVVAAQAWPM